MKLEELLKESPDVLQAVMNAVAKANEGQEDKTKHVRYADLSEGGYVSKAKYEELLAESQKNKTALGEANELLEAAKKATKDNPEIQNKLSAYKTTVAALEAELAKTKLNAAITNGLQAAGAVDTDYLTYKLTSAEGELKLGEDGKIVGWNEKITALKSQYPSQFAKEGKGTFEGYKIDKDEGNRDKEPSNLAEALAQHYENK